ncbi:translation elongation factor 4, partial [Patescibacteria group bacterium]|nr:translation elongation factor 4 [Patescibacteria group bacterium]
MNKQDLIRNFAIIAHVDHGKSTLSDRFLEITKTIAKDKLQEQFLDQNIISRRRGITIKLAPVRMNYTLDANNYMLNLIDTPGHVDFSYEVSRTLAACEGAVLLVDATQGIQAQTVAHYQVAKKLGLTMIPVLNKIDMPNAQVEVVTKELVDFGFNKEEILFISAKTGENVEKLLQEIIKKVPSPRGIERSQLRALIFDAVYDEYRGVIAYVRVMDGKVKKGDKIQFYQNGVNTETTEVGVFTPFLKETEELETGEIGYIVGGIKDIRQCRVGDTITISNIKDQKSKITPLPGYKTPQPMVFFGVYPKDANDFAHLRDSLGKLTLNDTALTYTEEYSAYLGSGFRVGFLGLLHADIVKERLKQEFDLDLLLTMPQVLYEKRSEEEIYEPYMLLNAYAPSAYVGNVMAVCQKKKGNLIDMKYHEGYAVLSYEMPYSMFIRGLAGEIKSVTAGFGSIDYELSDYKKADLVKLDILINTNPIDVLSELVYKDEAVYVARAKALKLKESLDRQQFRQIIQATVNNNIVAREEIPPFRKDVLAKMSGGDRTRKDKLLESQKKGKKKMIQTGKVSLSQQALFSMITE